MCLMGINQYHIASYYQVHQATISRVYLLKKWKHLFI